MRERGCRVLRCSRRSLRDALLARGPLSGRALWVRDNPRHGLGIFLASGSYPRVVKPALVLARGRLTCRGCGDWQRPVMVTLERSPPTAVVFEPVVFIDDVRSIWGA